MPAAITDHLQAKWIATRTEASMLDLPNVAYTLSSSRTAPTTMSIGIAVDGTTGGSPAVLARGIPPYRSPSKLVPLGRASQLSLRSRFLTLRRVPLVRGLVEMRASMSCSGQHNTDSAVTS